MEPVYPEQEEQQTLIAARTILQGRAAGESWHNVAFLVLDTETTGTDVEHDQIVELGAALYDGPTMRRRYGQRFHPGRPIPPDASRVHGIRDEDVADKPRFAEVAARLAVHLARARYLVGYNILSFDAPLLDAELARAGHPLRIERDRVLDVITFVRWHLRHNRLRTLSEICALCEVPLPQAHSACGDAEATGRLLLHLVDKGLIPATPAEALAEQGRLVAQLDDEWKRWAYWLYRDRKDGQTLRLGCGKHANLPLDRVDPGYCAFMLDKVSDLPAEVRQLFQARAKGERQGGVHLGAVPHG
jgi:DNA polymerase-3 subunit epsilon